MSVTLPPAELGELAAFRDLWAAAPAGVRRALGLATSAVGDGIAFTSAAAPMRELNRALGVTTVEELDGAETFFGDRETPFWVSLPPGTGLERELARRGYEPDYAWTKFSRPAAGPPAASTELVLGEVGRDRAGDFADTTCTGYGLPERFAPWMASLPGRPGWTCVVAYDGDSPVGAGTLVVEGDIGWLGLGATRPEARGRGSQSAILAHRIRRAAELGCRVVVTETGAPIDGRPGGSYRNILRAGFAEQYERPNYRAPSMPR